MRDVIVIIKTADRSPRVNYLEETLHNLARAGVFDSLHLHSLHIVDTGGSDWLESPLPINVALTVHSPRAGEQRTLHQNAAECIRVGGASSASLVLVIEDDLDFCDDFLGSVVRWIEDVEAHHCKAMMYALGANYAQINRVVAQGENAWLYPTHAFYGAQALLWHRHVARDLATWLGDDPSYTGIDGPVRDHGHDLLLQSWVKSQGGRIIASAPSFVQHIGNESGIGNKFFQFTSWPGRAWRYERRLQ